MKRFNLHIGAFLTLALAVSSCAEDELVKDYFVPSPSNTITFGASDLQVEVLSRSGKSNNAILSTTESKLVSEDGQYSLPMLVQVQEGIHRIGEAAPANRAAIVTDKEAIGSLRAWATHNVDGLYINGQNGDLFEKKDDGVFYSEMSYPWPEKNGTLDFMTVANHTSSFTPNFDAINQIVSFNYIVPEAATAQPDLLIAQAKGISDALGSSQPLNFKHIMAAVNFKVGEIKDINVTIKSIKLKGISNKGTYLVAYSDNGVNKGDEWTNRSIDAQNGAGEFTVLSTDMTVTSATTGNPSIGTTFMMIPQLLDSGAEVVIECHDNTNNKDFTMRAGIQGNEWKMNTTTNYLINIDESYNLRITPLDNLLDSHYIITKVDIGAEFNNWKLTAKANDGADVTLEFEDMLNPMAKIGFWTDKISKTKNRDGSYTYDGGTARGYSTIEGTETSSQVIVVFIPENISGETRKITLTLEGGDRANNLTAKKEIVLEQKSVKWLKNPYGDNPNLYWGCELLIEGGQIEWGFCFEGDQLIEQWRLQGKVTNQSPGWIDKIVAAMTAAGLNVNELYDPQNPIHIISRDQHNSTFLVSIDYQKLGVLLDMAKDLYDGEQNTLDLYGFEGINVISSIRDFLKANQGDKGVEHVPGTFTGEFETTIDFAAMYAMKRNRFNLYVKDVEGSQGVGATTMYVPIIENNDINWYLPAREQFPKFMDKQWGQQGFTFVDGFWTSTAAYQTENDNAHAYAYINGVETIAHRNDKLLTFALRKWTDNVGTPADKDLVGYVEPSNGDN